MRQNGSRPRQDPAPCPGLGDVAVIEIEITPEPLPAERAAILAALNTVLARRKADDGQPLPVWAEAGRREALLGRVERTRAGWGRGVDRSVSW